MTFLIYFMVYAGSALMAYNVFQYLRFAGDVPGGRQRRKKGGRERLRR